MLEAAPGAQLVTVPGVGHAPELIEPIAVAAIDDFLARFPAGLTLEARSWQSTRSGERV